MVLSRRSTASSCRLVPDTRDSDCGKRGADAVPASAAPKKSKAAAKATQVLTKVSSFFGEMMEDIKKMTNKSVPTSAADCSTAAADRGSVVVAVVVVKGKGAKTSPPANKNKSKRLGGAFTKMAKSLKDTFSCVRPTVVGF